MTNNSIKVKFTVVLVKLFLHKMFLYIFMETLFALTVFNISGKLIPVFNTMIKERPRFTSFYTWNNKI